MSQTSPAYLPAESGMQPLSPDPSDTAGAEGAAGGEGAALSEGTAVSEGAAAADGAAVTAALPERLDPVTAAPLSSFLSANRDRPLTLSALGLRRFDTTLLQFLLVAAADWQARGLAFRLCDLSGEHAALLDLAGVPQEALPRVTEPDLCL